MPVPSERGSPAHSRAFPSGAALSPEQLWDRHGASLYAMACALLVDESRAMLASTRGLVDLYRAPDAEPTLRTAAQAVFRQCRELATDDAGDHLRDVPSAREHWPTGMAWAGRAALALCFFGGHTYREAAVELGLDAAATAGLLVTGLRDLGPRSAPEAGG